MNRRQALAGLSAASLALVLAPRRSLALDSISPINAREARELGLRFRSQKSGGPNALWVELTFDAKEKLSGFTHVTLAMHDGEKLLFSTILSNQAQIANRFQVSFHGDRDLLGKATLSVLKFVGEGSEGYVLKVSDLDEVKQLR